MDHLRATFLLFDYQLDTIEENSDEFSSLIEYQKKGSKGQNFSNNSLSLEKSDKTKIFKRPK